jgi:hypothetical protein
MKKLMLMCLLLSGCVAFNPPLILQVDEVMVAKALKKEDLVLVYKTSFETDSFFFGEAYYGVNAGNYILYKSTGVVVWKPAGFSWVL